MTSSFNQDLISEIFGQQPELAYLGYLGQSGLGQSQQRFLRGKAADFLSRMQQAVGQQLAQGGLPTLTPEAFFSGLDFQKELFGYSPQERGMGTERFNPRTTFLFNR